MHSEGINDKGANRQVPAAHTAGRYTAKRYDRKCPQVERCVDFGALLASGKWRGRGGVGEARRAI